MKKVLVIVGPTGVGKTDLSLKCAHQFNGEIISGDSVQIYKGFDIGSGKVTDTEGIIHYGIDDLNYDEAWSVADFQTMARKNIDLITSKNKLPIIAGGTGLYVKACLYDYSFKSDENIQSYDFSNFTNEQVYDMLKEMDPQSAKAIHMNNRRRVERALTLAKNGVIKSEEEAKQSHEMLYDCKIIGCTMEREKLYARINKRVEMMFDEGLEDELKSLLASGITFNDQPMRGIGYKEWEAYFNNEWTKQQVKEKIQQSSRQFAKRQYTWFNNQLSVEWLDMNDVNAIQSKMIEIQKWLNDN